MKISDLICANWKILEFYGHLKIAILNVSSYHIIKYNVNIFDQASL